jgi:glycosyltransferase involved in cell wall biosynthesis
VKVTGWVEDIRPLLWASTVVLLPMRTGTGIKNKLLESWAAGIGTVVTPLACQGVPARDGENLLIGQTSEELAEQTLRLLTDSVLRQKLAEEGRATVAKNLTWMIAGSRFKQVVSQMKARHCGN